jgi:hypothetical protein
VRELSRRLGIPQSTPSNGQSPRGTNLQSARSNPSTKKHTNATGRRAARLGAALVPGRGRLERAGCRCRELQGRSVAGSPGKWQRLEKSKGRREEREEGEGVEASWWRLPRRVARARFRWRLVRVRGVRLGLNGPIWLGFVFFFFL